jgi:ketosteroid isomerase-like protein
MPEATGIPLEFLDEHVGLLIAGNTADLAQRYTEDAIIVRLDRVAAGRGEIKKFFDDYVAMNPVITEIDGLRMTDDVILYQAAENLDGQLKTAVGSLIFRGHLIWRQTVGFVDHRPT